MSQQEEQVNMMEDSNIQVGNMLETLGNNKDQPWVKIMTFTNMESSTFVRVGFATREFLNHTSK